METFYFAQENFQTNSNCFASYPEFVGQNGNDLLAIRKILDQLKMLCFCSDNN
jgi:hypothetical protein